MRTFRNQSAASEVDQDVAVMQRAEPVWFDSVPDEMLAIPYVIVVNSNAKIDGAAENEGNLYVSSGVGFIPAPVTVIPTALGKVDEVNERTGEAEQCFKMRGVLVEHMLPITMNFRRFARDPFRQMATAIKFRGDLGAMAFTLDTQVRSNVHGEWYIPSLIETDSISPAECRKIVTDVWSKVAAGASEDQDAPF